jgi:hypothetical protein
MMIRVVLANGMYQRKTGSIKTADDKKRFMMSAHSLYNQVYLE